MIEKLKKEILKARKNGDKERLHVLQALYSEIVAIGKNDGNRETTEEEAVKMIKKFRKGVETNIENLKKSGRESELNKYENELKTYDEFLPNPLIGEELEREIGLILGQESDINVGVIIKTLKEKFGERVDGKEASKMVMKLLKGV